MATESDPDANTYPIGYPAGKELFHSFYQWYHRQVFEADGSYVLNGSVSSAFHKSEVK